MVTTLVDSEEYSAEAIAQLYRRRRQAELNRRSLKIVLPIAHLRCKMPHRVRNEFSMRLLAYHLIRQLMAVAAFGAGVTPWTVSVQGTLQTINNLLPLLSSNISAADWCATLLEAIATYLVCHRPDRFEPRVRKRRPKKYKLLRKPRVHYQRRAA